MLPMRTATSRTVAAQNHRKIRMKRLRTPALLACRGNGVLITDVAHRLDPVHSTDASAEFAPQAAHVVIDTSIKHGKFPPKHLLKKLFARHHLSGSMKKHSKQIELRRCHFDQLAIAADHPRPRVEFNIADNKSIRFKRPIFDTVMGAPKDGMDAGDEFARIEGFR